MPSSVLANRSPADGLTVPSAGLLVSVFLHPKDRRSAVLVARGRGNSGRNKIGWRELSVYLLHKEEICMLDGARERAESFFERKQRQQSEGEQAWSEYQARQATIAENTARLRKLRLARDAGKRTQHSSDNKKRPCNKKQP